MKGLRNQKYQNSLQLWKPCPELELLKDCPRPTKGMKKVSLIDFWYEKILFGL